MDSIRVSEALDPRSIRGEATKFESMFYAYVLKSINHDFYYKGHCENLNSRLPQHNAGMTESIDFYKPFIIAFHEEFDTRAEVIKKEKYFKTAAGRRFFKTKLSP